jgi:hypothetical protein
LGIDRFTVLPAATDVALHGLAGRENRSGTLHPRQPFPRWWGASARGPSAADSVISGRSTPPRLCRPTCV